MSHRLIAKVGQGNFYVGEVLKYELEKTIAQLFLDVFYNKESLVSTVILLLMTSNDPVYDFFFCPLHDPVYDSHVLRFWCTRQLARIVAVKCLLGKMSYGTHQLQPWISSQLGRWYIFNRDGVHDLGVIIDAGLDWVAVFMMLKLFTMLKLQRWCSWSTLLLKSRTKLHTTICVLMLFKKKVGNRKNFQLINLQGHRCSEYCRKDFIT